MDHSNDNAPGDLLMGAAAIAGALGITRRQAYKLIYAGDLPTFKLGGTVSARRSSILATIAAKEAAANTARAA
ncbi:DNA-binding protein [Mesorhizobium qingshengii]|uniref:DNA-binding protein n=1 Tax=Mesorhizobium qingshengii TaxID=1165689 RepID=A0ABT4QXH1_9HYPH|nr:DNA-binding protein [Mesorhizobium qingshengii]MCZ8546281.1 DNA-binding protein [Mesorhizobium qingshengii]